VHQPGRDVGRRMVVALSNRSRIVVVTSVLPMTCGCGRCDDGRATRRAPGLCWLRPSGLCRSESAASPAARTPAGRWRVTTGCQRSRSRRCRGFENRRRADMFPGRVVMLSLRSASQRRSCCRRVETGDLRPTENDRLYATQPRHDTNKRISHSVVKLHRLNSSSDVQCSTENSLP